MHGVVDVDPNATVNVHGGVGDAMARFRRPERRGVDVDIGREILGQPPRRLRHGQPQRLDVDVAVGQPRGDSLEAADRPVELLTLAGIFGGELERPLQYPELKCAAAQRAVRGQPVHDTSSPPTTRSALNSTPCSSRCAMLPWPVVCNELDRGPESDAATTKTLVPESVSAGTRNASATGP